MSREMLIVLEWAGYVLAIGALVFFLYFASRVQELRAVLPEGSLARNLLASFIAILLSVAIEQAYWITSLTLTLSNSWTREAVLAVSVAVWITQRSVQVAVAGWAWHQFWMSVKKTKVEEKEEDHG